MKTRFSTLVIVGITVLTMDVRADLKWYYNEALPSAGGGWKKIGPFDSESQAEDVKANDPMQTSDVYSQGNLDTFSAPGVSAPGLNPIQQQTLNTIGQAGYQFGFALGQSLFSPTPPDPKVQEATALNNQGVNAWKAGDYETAKGYYQQAIGLCPDNPTFQANFYDNLGCEWIQIAAQAAQRRDKATELTELQNAVGDFEKALGYVPSNQYLQQRLAGARQDLSQLEEKVHQDTIAADLDGKLRLSNKPGLTGLNLSDGSQLAGPDPNNPLGLKITSVAQLESAANNGFDGGQGSGLNTSAAAANADDNLHPQGTSFFGLGGGPANSSAQEPTGDPNVVDLRNAKTLTVDPAVVQSNPSQMQSVGGAGTSDQDVANQSASGNPPSQQPDADNPLGLKITSVAQVSSESQSTVASAQQPVDGDSQSTTHLKDGLPGTYLNDASANGNNNPGGISGLPGVYVNGPRSESDATGPSDTTLRPLNQIESGVRGTGQGDSGQPNQTETESALLNAAPPPEASGQESQAPNPNNVESTSERQSAANNSPNANFSAVGQLASVASSSSGFDGGGGSTINLTRTAIPATASGPTSDPNVVDLEGKAVTVAPSTLQESPSSGSFSAPGAPIATAAPGKENPTGYYYQKSMGYQRPLSSSEPSPQPYGALGAKLARFQGVIDAMYAADSSYTTNRYPPGGYSIRQMFTLVHDGTDAVLYGKMGADGNPINLILAFRGTVFTNLDDWKFKNYNNTHGGSQAYVSSVLIARRVQKEFPNTPITLSGHSLGGGEAALASVATGMPAITFNAAGVRPSDYGYSAAAETSQITNYHVVGEILTTAQNRPPVPALTTPPALASVKSLPSALGNQISVPALTIDSKNPLTDIENYATTAGNHSMSEVEPALINYLSQ